MKQVKNFLSLIKFSHTIFAMPFALIGFFLAVKKFAFISWDGQWNLNKTIVWRGARSVVPGWHYEVFHWGGDRL